MTGEQRRKHIIEILKRWGRLDRAQISSILSQQIGEDLDSPSGNKLILRDLNKLVENHELSVQYFTRDDSPIPDYEINPAIYKNVKCFWQIAGKDFSISGEGILDNFNISLKVPKFLTPDVSIHSSEIKISKDHIHLFFSDDLSKFCLKINKSAAPFTILISGKLKDEIDEADLIAIEELYGKRTLSLNIPNRFISKGYTKGTQGHFLVEYKGNINEVYIEDLDSTNGTQIETSEPTLKYRLIKEATEINEKTITDDLLDSDKFRIPTLRLKEKERIELPSKIRIGNNIEIIVI
jgi:hypothetical protein